MTSAVTPLDTNAPTLASLGMTLHECPICRGVGFSTLARHDRNLLGLRTAGCLACGLIQTNPRPSKEGLDLFYRDHYRLYYQGAITPDAEYIGNLNKDVRLASTAGYFSDILALDRDAAVLDYGCGEGSLFAALRKHGFTGKFYGVELNASFGEFASKYGDAIVSNSIRSRELVALVTVNHVLEHLADPIGTLRELAGVLSQHGRLYVDVPDAEEYSSIQDLHLAHIFHFSVRTLRRMVEAAGYEVVSCEKHRPPFHPPSIRLTATVKPVPEAVVTATSAAGERAAWLAVRRCGRLLNTVRLRLRTVKVLHRAYQAARRISRRDGRRA